MRAGRALQLSCQLGTRTIPFTFTTELVLPASSYSSERVAVYGMARATVEYTKTQVAWVWWGGGGGQRGGHTGDELGQWQQQHHLAAPSSRRKCCCTLLPAVHSSWSRQ